MEIARIILRVADMEEAVGFWVEKVGLSVVSEGGPFVFLDGWRVQLALNEVGVPVEDASLTEIVFEVEDVQGAYKDMAVRGVEFEVEPRPVTSDGERELWATHFRDPDGHLASITGWVEGQPGS